MAFKSSLLLILVCLLHSVAQGKFDRNSFPPGFIFGTASSAYQYEGATGRKHKQDSIWDIFVEEYPEKVNHNTGKIAEEFYFRYKEDVRRMKELGLDAFRFSIAWSRLFNYDQDGNWDLNLAGVEFYRNLIEDIVHHGMKPFVTLFHWDTPQHLEKHGGFLNDSIVDQFVEYANACFNLFGDKVKHWITFNEPHNFCGYGYASGQLAPGRCTHKLLYGDIIALRRFPSSEPSNCREGNSATEPYIVARHILLAHAKAVRLYWDLYKRNQKGSVGITLNVNWVLPWDNSEESRLAKERALAFTFGWFMDPLYKGTYPIEMVEYVGKRLQPFSPSESKLLKGTYDFIGLNYYTAAYARNMACPKVEKSYLTDSCVNLTYYNASNDPIGPQASSWLYVYPQGIKDLMLYAGSTYGNPVIYITENGVDRPNANATFGLDDTLRIEYHVDHLSNLSQVIQDIWVSPFHVDVQGYFIWSLLDNFEWSEGYGVRFGLVYIDYTNNLAREFKDSAKWLKSFLKP